MREKERRETSKRRKLKKDMGLINDIYWYIVERGGQFKDWLALCKIKWKL